MRKPSREQLKKAGVICAKIAIGDYWGAAQDLSQNSLIFVKPARPEQEAEASA